MENRIFRLESREEIDNVMSLITDNHPLLEEVYPNYEDGAEMFIMKNNFGTVVSINQTRLSKSKSSIWRPYANFCLAYTIKKYRRLGYAKNLLLYVTEYARKSGCRRIKSLAASVEGLSLHLSVAHKFWGRTPNNEICIDTGIIDCEGWKDRIPPSVSASRLIENFCSMHELEESLKKNPLCFDR